MPTAVPLQTEPQLCTLTVMPCLMVNHALDAPHSEHCHTHACIEPSNCWRILYCTQKGKVSDPSLLIPMGQWQGLHQNTAQHEVNELGIDKRHSKDAVAREPSIQRLTMVYCIRLCLLGVFEYSSRILPVGSTFGHSINNMLCEFTPLQIGMQLD